MAYLTDAEGADLVRRHFTVNQDIALAVAIAEDGGQLNTLAHNTSGEDSRGLWQINVAPGANPQYASWDLYDPDVNAQAAFEISSGGTYWCPWSVYEEECDIATGCRTSASGPCLCRYCHTGSYRNYLDRARAAFGIQPTPHYPASDLYIDPFWITNCVISTVFHWTRGYPNLTGQRLDLAVYPLGFEQGRSFNLPASAESVPFTGFYPKAGFYWRIVSFFSDNPELYSPQHEFIAPALPPECTQPPYYPWPFIPPEWQYGTNITMLLGAGLVATSLILAAMPRKKKVIIKR